MNSQGAPHCPGGWLPSPGIQGDAHLLLREKFEQHDLAAFSAWAGSRPGHGLNDDLFNDALYDLRQLLEEYGFEVSIGTMYAEGLSRELDDIADQYSRATFGFGVPPKVRAMLSAYAAFLPSPSDLLRDPGATMSGYRVLGGWWAGQLIDSAIVRGHSALDRMITLMTCAVETKRDLRFKKDGSQEFLPSFTLGYLKKLDRLAPGDSSVASLKDLWTGAGYQSVRNYRDGIVHRTRQPMYLHGNYFDFANATTIAPAQSVTNHLQLPVSFFADVILPAADYASEFVRDH